MKILIINAGSSSIKYQLIDMKNEQVIAKGNVEKIGNHDSFLTHKAKGGVHSATYKMSNHSEALEQVLKALQNEVYGVIKSLNEIDAIGHRVVHGGTKYSKAVLVTDEVLKDIDAFTPLAPLHNPPNKLGIIACRQVMPGKPNIAVFDTAFHASIPDYAHMYALPYEWYQKYRVRKYGFHGTSHEYIANEVARVTKKKNLKIIVCHIGNGASMSAIKDGKSVETSMGLTPLEGLVMGTRCGDIDPAIIEYMTKQANMTVEAITNDMNKKSGLLGISGISNDIRDVIAEIEKGNDRARLAYEMYNYRIKKYIGSYAAALGGVDVIAFTAGSGENQAGVRREATRGLEFMGIEIDEKKNTNFRRGEIELISKPTSKVAVYIIPTDEELSIARQTKNIVDKN